MIIIFFLIFFIFHYRKKRRFINYKKKIRYQITFEGRKNLSNINLLYFLKNVNKIIFFFFMQDI